MEKYTSAVTAAAASAAAAGGDAAAAAAAADPCYLGDDTCHLVPLIGYNFSIVITDMTASGHLLMASSQSVKF